MLEREVYYVDRCRILIYIEIMSLTLETKQLLLGVKGGACLSSFNNTNVCFHPLLETCR